MHSMCTLRRKCFDSAATNLRYTLTYLLNRADAGPTSTTAGKINQSQDLSFKVSKKTSSSIHHERWRELSELEIF